MYHLIANESLLPLLDQLNIIRDNGYKGKVELDLDVIKELNNQTLSTTTLSSISITGVSAKNTTKTDKPSDS